MADHLELLPAVDVQGGVAVQLVQGSDGSERRFGDPVAAALRWQVAGAWWIHLADLDRAFGHGTNAAVLAEIVGRLDVDVQLSGGVRDDESLMAALATGCRRAVIGTAALADPGWCARAVAEHGDRVAIGLDVRGRVLAPRGGVGVGVGGDVVDTVARLTAEGCARFVVTDVDRDGALAGPNLDLLWEVCATTDRPVVASGGVTTLDDVAALRALVPIGVEGAIVGSALHEGRFGLADALAVARARR